MLQPSEPRPDGCAEFRRAAANRRSFLTAGVCSGLGLALPDLLRVRDSVSAAERVGHFGQAKSVIFLFLHGGNPQHETWDPKPRAPAEVRGEFGPISTSVPDVQISELFPQIAQMTDRLSIIRSMSHGNTNHVQACLPAMTGHKHSPAERRRGDFPPSETDFPPFGAVMDHMRPAASGLPTWVQVGPQMTRSNTTVLHGQLPGFLGRKHSPFVIDQKLTEADVSVEALQVPEEIPRLRVKQRRDLLASIDSQRRMLDQSAVARDLDDYYHRAFNLLTSTATRDAFDLASEPTQVRERYGSGNFAQGCLLARRLAEAGVPIINVHFCKTPRGSWDTHGKNFTTMKDVLAPQLDQAFSALVTDLEERGLLDQTVVVANAEFGRTPKVNSNAGRDHWPFVYSLAIAGGGFARGVVEGASDQLAAYPASKPYDPADLAATIYHLLGVPPQTTLMDKVGRPHGLIVGKPIRAVLA